MAKPTRIRNYAQISAVSAAHAMVCRCQQIFATWEQARSPAEQQAQAQAYYAALEGLFELLEEQLGGLVATIALGQLHDQDRLLVQPEVPEHLVLNMFVAIVYRLPKLPLEATTELPGALLAVAEQSLYTID